jgi:hypothetical protein
MARTAGKKQAPAKIEEDDDNEGWEDAVVEADGKDAAADLRLRDWRDVERFREMKDLRRLVDDDYGLEEIFHVPLKPRIEVPPRTPKLAPAAKLKLVAAQRAADQKTAAKAVVIARPAPGKHAPAKKAAPAKPKAKAKTKVKPKAKHR